jgi:hypothetical protein
MWYPCVRPVSEEETASHKLKQVNDVRWVLGTRALRGAPVWGKARKRKQGIELRPGESRDERDLA